MPKSNTRITVDIATVDLKMKATIFLNGYLILLFLLSPLSMFGEAFTTDSCLYGDEPELVSIDSILEDSIKQTINSREWQEKNKKRTKGQIIRVAKWMALPVALMGLGFYSGNSDISTKGAWMLFGNLVAASIHCFEVNEKEKQSNICELEIQKMYDLTSGGYSDEASKILDYLKRRKDDPHATGEDVGRYYAAKIGAHAPSMSPELRSKWAVGPSKRWDTHHEQSIINYFRMAEIKATDRVREKYKLGTPETSEIAP